jgi:hypothetical protein
MQGFMQDQHECYCKQQSYRLNENISGPEQVVHCVGIQLHRAYKEQEPIKQGAEPAHQDQAQQADQQQRALFGDVDNSDFFIIRWQSLSGSHGKII